MKNNNDNANNKILKYQQWSREYCDVWSAIHNSTRPSVCPSVHLSVCLYSSCLSYTLMMFKVHIHETS